MLVVVGFKKDEIEELMNIDDVYSISKTVLDMPLKEIIENRPEVNFTVVEGRKFVIIHNVPKENIAKMINSIRDKFGSDIIFATTTPTSLNWKVSDLLQELLEEDTYFRNRRVSN